MPDRKFHGAIRAFARQLIEQHGGQHPFDNLQRIERRLSQLERENVIRYDWGRSQNYDVVTAITLVDERAVHPPRRKLLRRRDATSPDAQQRRRMELLAALVHLGGSCPSVRELTRTVAREYGDHHRPGTLIVDTQALARSRAIEKRPHRVAGKPVQQISITANGRRMLERYRQEHDGEPKPPVPTDIGAAPSADAAPTLAAAPSTAAAIDTQRREAVLATLRTCGGTFVGALPLARATQEAHPTVGSARQFEAVIRMMLHDGVLWITGARVRRKPMTLVLPAHPPPPPTAPPAAPPAAVATAAPAQTDGPLSEAVRAIDADIGRANAEIDQLQRERAELEGQLQALDRRRVAIEQRVGRLQRLRQDAVAAYTDPAPTTDNASAKQ